MLRRDDMFRNSLKDRLHQQNHPMFHRPSSITESERGPRAFASRLGMLRLRGGSNFWQSPGQIAGQQPSQSLFGSTSPNQNQQQQNPFGAQANPQASQSPFAGFGTFGGAGQQQPVQSAPNLFGQPMQQQGASSLFGQPAQQQPAGQPGGFGAGGGSSFGSFQGGGGGGGSSSSGFPFGGNAPPFGASGAAPGFQPASSTVGGGGLFGNQPAPGFGAPGAAWGGGWSNNKTAVPGFGQAPQQQQQQQQQQQPNGGGGLFG
eukprot:CAMPEP_0113669816 /NCGR_PEP_ID=MMETSP0038_2-20120614/4787_1 /TAXON_ID=2898 /ORGANISM="Cryptomonas paramecium" /LENGTH=259 /DNA_ID=CAMNT_0000585755 /DNA_START=101 /DNA_END=877 /DNA_ORIENTATION=- /assembly_acc=CAM_ASM_000170